LGLRRRQAEADRLANLSVVLCSDRSIRLPPASIDLAFICDTYHHFEYPASTLASIHRALRPQGQLVVIDFERIPGQSRDWVLEHVRAGKAEFRSEIEAAGFEFAAQPEIRGFRENYLLRFRKKAITGNDR
jgi:predicted methyltransferase